MDRNTAVSIEDFVRLKHEATNLWISASIVASIYEDSNIIEDASSLSLIVPAISETCSILSLSFRCFWLTLNIREGKQEDVFKLIKASDEEVWETYILINTIPVLKKAPMLFQAVSCSYLLVVLLQSS